MKVGDRVLLKREDLEVTVSEIVRNRVTVDLDDEPYLNVHIDELKESESE